MKKEFRNTLSWMRKAQTASLFVPGITVSVEIQYTPANDNDSVFGKYTAYTCEIRVHGKNGGEYESAEYSSWGGVGVFDVGKEKVSELLRSYGVNI